MEALTVGDGIVPVWPSLWRSLSSLMTIASGGSIGREGSMVQLAALSSSIIGRVFRLGAPRLRLLVACGAAAGITSAYSAPIAGAVFVTELVLGSMEMEWFGPILISAVTANVTMREFVGYHPVYQMPSLPTIAGIDVLPFVGLGILCGTMAPVFLKSLSLAKDCFSRPNIPAPVRLGLGGLIVGVVSLRTPEVWGNGYEVVNSLLHEPWTWSALVLVLLFKIVATLATVGTGAIGGVFTPTLFVGATIGCLFGMGVHDLLPLTASAPFAYAIVGMGAFLAATTQAPLMAIIMVFEMTLSYSIALPLVLACILACYVSKLAGNVSMYEVTLRRNEQETRRTLLRSIAMKDLIQPADTVVSLTSCVSDIAKLFLDKPTKYAYVVDASGYFVGVVRLNDIASLLLSGRDLTAHIAADLVRAEVVALTADLPLEAALRRFVAFDDERLPVIISEAVPILSGVVCKSSLLSVYRELYAMQAA